MGNTASSLPPGPLYFQGESPRALFLSGQQYVLPELKGRGTQLKVTHTSKSSQEPPSFTADSGRDGFALRLTADPDLSLECAYRKFNEGDKCSLWSINGHSEWAVRWTLNDDNTISPSKNRGVVLGVSQEGAVPILVARNSPQRLVLERSSAGKERQQAELVARREETRVLVAMARDLTNEETLDNLNLHGFAHIPGAISPHLVRAALREVNRELGASTAGTGGVDAFRAKTFASRSEIKALFNCSVLPLIMCRLLGPLPSGAPYHQSHGQLALRFPGDMCPQGDPALFSHEHFDRLRLSWHIDGLPSAFLPGRTDHWGEIHNFDCLVGVLLEDVTEHMSGELCLYPGSHLSLAEHYRAVDLLPRLYKEGGSALPTGSATDRVLNHVAPHHCLGKAGDVFLLNYGTAHFVNANTSPKIRYAVYFRVRGPAFGSFVHNAEGMLNPTVHWRLHSELEGAHMQSSVASQIASDEKFAWSLVANNDYTVPKEFRK